MIRGIKLTSVPVTDQDRALSFYTEKLGFSIQTDQPYDENRRWIELRITGAETRLVLFTPDEPHERVGGRRNMVFWTDDVEGTYEELKERGVEFDDEPREQPWGTFTTFRDPDDNQFVLSSKR